VKIACVAIVRNEAAHIAEWLAYQFACGFDTVLLFDNLSTDATKANAEAVAQHHDVRMLDWPVSTPDYQLAAYRFACAHLGDEFEWAAFLDTDEFLVFQPGHDVRGRLAARAEASAVAISWAIFGASGHRAAPPGLVIENFLYRAQADFGANRHVKSIIRPTRLRACQSSHNFAMLDGPTVDLEGRRLKFLPDGQLDGMPDYSIAQVNHYFTRSLEHWSAKLARGYHDTTRAFAEFRNYDKNTVFDDGALRLLPAVKSILAGVSAQ
jgi:hypothetical protein